MPRSCCRAVAVALILAAGVIAAPARASEAVPTDGPALLKWLQSGHYKAWPKESAPHRSMGSHQTLVITYLSPALDKSLGAKAKAHPAGSTSVKELLDPAGKLAGWAVAVKTAADGEGGKGWFWYEVQGTIEGRQAVQGQGLPLCVGCHARGRDAVLTEHPLD